MRRPVSSGMRYAPNGRRARSATERRPAVKKTITVQAFRSEIFEGQKLTIGLDLGDRWSFYCVLDEAGQVILEQKLPTTPEAMKQTFGKIPRSLIALETGTHSPWVSRVLTEVGHEVIVAHAQKVQLITKSNRKDDRHDPRTLARLARIDPELLGPLRHRSVQAQIHLTVIRAQAELGRARTRVCEVLWSTAAQVWHAAGEPGAGRGLEHRVAGGSGAVAQRNRIAERGHQGIRRADGENRQGSVPGSVLAQASEGCRNADRADVCANHRRPTPVSEESRGRLFSGAETWPEELRRERATEENQ